MYFKVMKSEHGDARHDRHVDSAQFREKNAWDLFPSPLERRRKARGDCQELGAERG